MISIHIFQIKANISKLFSTLLWSSNDGGQEGTSAGSLVLTSSADMWRKPWNQCVSKREESWGWLFFFYLSLVFSVRPGLSAGGKATWFLRGTCSCSIVAWFPPMGLPQGTLWKASPAAQVIPQPRHTFLISSPGSSDNLQRSGQSQGFHAAATRHRQRGRSLLLASKRKC